MRRIEYETKLLDLFAAFGGADPDRAVLLFSGSLGVECSDRGGGDRECLADGRLIPHAERTRTALFLRAKHAG